MFPVCEQYFSYTFTENPLPELCKVLPARACLQCHPSPVFLSRFPECSIAVLERCLFPLRRCVKLPGHLIHQGSPVRKGVFCSTVVLYRRPLHKPPSVNLKLSVSTTLERFGVSQTLGVKLADDHADGHTLDCRPIQLHPVAHTTNHIRLSGPIFDMEDQALVGVRTC